MSHDTDLCAECDTPIVGRPDYFYPSERWRFCSACSSWRAKNLAPPLASMMDLDRNRHITDSVVLKATQEFYRRNCVEVEA